MTTFTATDLATRVLKDLGLLGAEETPSGADTVWALETCASEISMLEAKGINIWNGSTDIIPQEYLTVLSRRIGLAIAPSYGLSDPAASIAAEEAAEVNLRRLGQVGPTYATLQSEYF